MDLVTAVRRRLVSVAEITDLVGPPSGVDSPWDHWVFAWRLYVNPESFGTSAVVVSQHGGHAVPNRHNTMRFPRLQVEVYSDPDRDSSSNPSVKNAEDKAHELFDEIDKVLHVPQGGELNWSGLRVLNCTRGGEPDTSEVPDSDSAVRLLANYDVTLG